MNIFARIAISLTVTLFGVFIAAAIRFVRLPSYAAAHPIASPTPTLPPTATPNPCAEEAKDYNQQISPIIEEWRDAEKLAEQSPRMSLTPAIANLQTIRRKMGRMEPTHCVIDIHFDFVGMMDESIDGFLAFLGQRDSSIVNEHFRKSVDMLDSATTKLTAMKK